MQRSKMGGVRWVGFVMFVLCGMISNSAEGQSSLCLGEPFRGNCDSNAGGTQNDPQNDTTLLPPIEADAYLTMSSTLEILRPPSVSSICKSNQENITFTCVCDRNNNNISVICNVVEIYISGIGLTGAVSEAIANFTHLKHLDLSMNKLHGAIPDSLGGLSSLLSIDLSSNFLSGSIPPSFARLSSLHTLYHYMNLLSGTIPHFLGKLTNLTYLDLGDNQFSGTLPPGFQNLTSLRSFRVPSNNITGAIPNEYAELIHLSEFHVGGNSMSGRIPGFIKNWINLTSLILLGNNFEGILPPEIFKFSSIQYLWVSDIVNSGFTFPTSANLTNLRSLILRNCSVQGEIPPYIGNMSSLEYLDLSFNNITGGIPNSVQNLSFLFKMSLAGNKLNGAFPYWLTKKDTLMADLSYNSLQVNETLRFQNLSNLNLFGCCLPSSTIKGPNMASPFQIMEEYCPNRNSKYDSLHINCGGNEQIIDKIRYEHDNDTSSFHVSEGKWAYSCSGEFIYYSSSEGTHKVDSDVFDLIAPLYGTARLCPTSLAYYGFCLHKGYYKVGLHFTEIVYAKDEDHRSSKKRVFDIYIQGKLMLKDFNIKVSAAGPNRAFMTYFIVYVNDSLMLKIQLFWAGKGSLYEDPLLNGPLISAISATQVVEVGKRKLNTLQIALISIASIILLVLLVCCLAWKMGWLARNTAGLPRKDWNDELLLLEGTKVTVKQLCDATQNFSPKMEIGRGVSGIVYRAELLHQIVAVKRLLGKDRHKFYRLESYVLKSIRHEHLVRLLDVYSGDKLQLIVYEYMDNGTLANALFDYNSPLKLDWETRFAICLGVAKGLQYLHEGTRHKIIHTNIKASTVLLDGTLKAKISGYNFAMLHDETNAVVDHIPGTHGYMAPEFAMRGIISDKSDIYSFGVLLFEIVSGKPINTIDAMSGSYEFLLDVAYDLRKKGRLSDLIDSKLGMVYDRKEANTVLELGMICTSISPGFRPKISAVVAVLEGRVKINQIDLDENVASGTATFREFASTSNDFSIGSTKAERGGRTSNDIESDTE